MKAMPILPLRARRLSGRALLLLFAVLVCAAPCVFAVQEPWSAVGPDGGDARSLTGVPGQPDHIYMGSTDSWIYESFDAGASWHRLARLDASGELIVDHILVDSAHPAVLYAGAWAIGHPDGGVWISHDAGHTWKAVADMRGQSIRALVQAPSNPRVLYAGAMGGVFRSADAGLTWTLISPPGSLEIHEIESLAVDPRDSGVVYAGTWHLPWKTFDAGKNWASIKQGLIDDSDVFSIVLDPVNPDTVFLSACSGIYKSGNGAFLFRKIQGIPSSARRTRALRQDPVHRNIVYAGTTEGLYKTVDGGATFQRMTGPGVIVNDVYVDANNPDRVLLATDRGGVLLSRDGGRSFTPSNQGFSGRKVEALLVDSTHPARFYAGVVNDKTYGGVFVSSDSGATWSQIADGLDGSDVFALAQAPDGTLLAGTNRGLFLLDPPAAGALRWMPTGAVQNFVLRQSTVLLRRRRIAVQTSVKDTPGQIQGHVYALNLSGQAWLASTSTGLFTSRDHGATWQGGPVLGGAGYLSVAVQGATMAAAQRSSLVLSTDAGRLWMPVPLPAAITRIDALAFSPGRTLWLVGREGVHLTRDLGKTWLWINRLPLRDINDVSYDPAQGRVLVSSRSSDLVFALDPQRLDWTWLQTGWHLSLIRSAAGRLVAASLYDGVVVQPRAQAAGAASQ